MQSLFSMIPLTIAGFVLESVPHLFTGQYAVAIALFALAGIQLLLVLLILFIIFLAALSR